MYSACCLPDALYSALARQRRGIGPLLNFFILRALTALYSRSFGVLKAVIDLAPRGTVPVSQNPNHAPRLSHGSDIELSPSPSKRRRTCRLLAKWVPPPVPENGSMLDLVLRSRQGCQAARPEQRYGQILPQGVE